MSKYKEYGDVISTTSLAHKLIFVLRGEPDVKEPRYIGEDEAKIIIALEMVDGTTTTITLESNYDPALEERSEG